MSEVTAVPLRPIAKGSLTKLWIGVAILAAAGIGFAWSGTSRQVAMSESPETYLARNAQKSGVHQTASGLQYQVLHEGSGANATTNDMVLVDYEGKLADGTVFDASSRHGGPAPLPVGGLIPGWTEGLQLMNSGAKYRFWIKPELGYGAAGAGDGVIPPNALLIFDVTVHAILPQSQGAPGMGGAGGMGDPPHEGAPSAP
jgi:hypothetical protein